MTAEEAFQQAYAYINKTALGGGALKGKNVTISSIDPIDGGNRITFSYTLDTGEKKEETLDVMDGKPGDNGFSPIITPNLQNDEETYRLDILDANGILTTINLMGKPGQQGIPGQQGRQGEQGIQGIQGIKGEQGDPFLIYKEYGALEEFQASDFYAVGQMFGVKPSEEGEMYNVYRYSGEGEPPYTFVTSLGTGESIKGDPGLPGEQGVPGEKGDDGTTYTPKIGTVTEGEKASVWVEIDEETKEAVFNFVVPKSTKTYGELYDKPKINDILVDGNKSLEDFGIQPKGEYPTIDETVSELGLSINPVDYVMTLELKNSKGEVLSVKTVDFPLESMVVGASYNKYTKELVLSLQNGQTLEPIDISNIVNGLVPDGRTIAGIDLKDDITADELKNTLFPFGDVLKYLDESYGMQDTPIGHILTYMGNNPPKHYLKCDGATYTISQYPYLAQHFKDEFGKVNHFGGNGTTTFAVPDLRGEFLRGTGTATRDSGSGADVGKHQDGTKNFNITMFKNFLTIGKNVTSETPEEIIDYDKKYGVQDHAYIYTSDSSTTLLFTPYFTSRPTNTSVLYCIKYEPTYFMVVNK